MLEVESHFEWLHFGPVIRNTAKGATASSVIFSIVEIAKANELKLFHYLEHLFEKLPKNYF